MARIAETHANLPFALAVPKGPQGRSHQAALCNGVAVVTLAGELRGHLAYTNRAPTANIAAVTSEHRGRFKPHNAAQDARDCWIDVECGGSCALSGRVALRNGLSAIALRAREICLACKNSSADFGLQPSVGDGARTCHYFFCMSNKNAGQIGQHGRVV